MMMIKLAQFLLVSMLTVHCAGCAEVAQEYFDAVAAPAGSCTAQTVTVDARSDSKCAMVCSQDGASLSYSFINGVCVLSDSSECAAADAPIVFRKRRTISYPGYEMQVGGRRFWVFQQRQTGQVNFARNWTEYEQGFGDNNGTEFWSGLYLIHDFTKSRSPNLRMEMTTVDGVLYVAEWLNFTVGGAGTNYTMNCGAIISGSSNISGDQMNYHRGRQFSTMDRDHDTMSGSCSLLFGSGGFWFSSCYQVNPNGLHSYVNQRAIATAAVYHKYISADAIESYKTLRATRMMLQL